MCERRWDLAVYFNVQDELRRYTMVRDPKTLNR